MELKPVKDKALNDLYVKRYKDFLRLVRISKMLGNSKIMINTNNIK